MTPEERERLIQDIASAVNVPVVLSYDEQRWVKMAIQREADRAALRKAIIEKTFAGLAWSAIAAFGLLIVDFLKNHGMKF